MKYILSTFLVIILLSGCSDNSTNSDDNLMTVKIGTYQWAKTNLDVDHYRNGDIIPQVTDTTVWKNLTSGAWCYYNNDPEMGKLYGKMYNWYAVNDPRGLAPKGFHVATNDEWDDLVTSLGGEDVAGGKLKDDGTDFWSAPNKDATNSSGFKALPGGGRDTNGAFMTNKYYGGWWTSTSTGSLTAWYRSMSHITGMVYKVNYKIRSGFSVRCVKD